MGSKLSTISKLNNEWSTNLQAELDEYMGRLISWYIDNEEEGEEPETISGQPFCGCDTCYWREYLAFTAPKIIEGYLAKKIELE